MKRSLSEQFCHYLIIHILCVIHGCKTGFLRECIIIKPIKKQLVHSDSTLHKLGSMNMQVRECRYDQTSAIIFYLHSLKFLRKSFINSLNETILHYQIAVLKYFQFLYTFRIQNISMTYKIRHFIPPELIIHKT